MNDRMPYLYLAAVKDELARAYEKTFAGVDRVEITRDDFASFMNRHPDVDGIVSPANSFGLLTGGFDKAIREYFGMELQKAVREKIQTEWFGEQTVGTSMALDIPGNPGKKLIHTPTMRTPSVILDYQVVYLCMRSALMAAIEEGTEALLVPAFGGGAGKVPAEVIARNMRSAYDQIKGQLNEPHMAVFRTSIRILHHGIEAVSEEQSDGWMERWQN